ncbi:MAG: Uma2 family endonuclease [Candidatus Cloacimonetes bacterium]|nr:Uma2 family endonuclease [Candidatus Cloacimonadota bacterium]
MTQPLIKKDKIYTYQDYLSWDEDVRYELIDGVAYALAAPLQIHQIIHREVSYNITGFLKGKKCMLLYAPSSVKLNASELNDTVFEPDLFVVCDRSKLDGRTYNGVPDLIIEITSPSTARIDKVYKFHKYLQAGVKEYWIIEPDIGSISVFVLENNNYTAFVYENTDKVPSKVLDGLVINMAEVFAEIEFLEKDSGNQYN